MDSLGRRNFSSKRRAEEVSQYLLSPNFCKTCGLSIAIRKNQSVSDVRKKKFCSHKCSSTLNNRGTKRGPKFTNKCACGTLISRRAKRCRTCADDNANRLAKMTKGELIAKNKYWTQWRNRISSHARIVYQKSGRSKKCAVCGYDLHIDVAHIKDVSDFPNSATIAEINNPSNLLGLCPNHHWEFDNGLLNLQVARAGIEPALPPYESSVIPTSLSRDTSSQ